jgi:hypothetical protein
MRSATIEQIPKSALPILAGVREPQAAAAGVCTRFFCREKTAHSTATRGAREPVAFTSVVWVRGPELNVLGNHPSPIARTCR